MVQREQFSYNKVYSKWNLMFEAFDVEKAFFVAVFSSLCSCS